MILLGILGIWELLVPLGIILLFVVPFILKKRRGTQDYTEKLDQLERLERLYRDGSLTKREFNRLKRKIMKRS